AEVGCAEHDGSIVLDDPVSSLDEERREYIARRLVAEARERQVIIFTHDLAFMLDLVEQAQAKGVLCAQQSVWRIEDAVGRIDAEPPFLALSLKRRVGRLSDRVQNWPKPEEFESQDEAWTKICDFYRQARLTWERAVEERIFGGVVQRFQREVKTPNFGRVQATKELITEVEEGIDRCSDFVHDQPPAAGTILPRRSELSEEVEKLREFETRTRPH
ncbi:MAG: hypothetical protein M3355_09670, partial [Actinomycetota bacterium]|nr:hypothetical protein [Actinomycetota bacterium]